MKIVFIVNCSFSAWWFRKGLLKHLVRHGHNVVLVAPADVKYNDHVRSIGVRHIPVRMNRFFSPVRDVAYLCQLYAVLRREQPQIVHNYTIKPNIYGTLAARLAGIKQIFCSVTGLGYLFGENIEPAFRCVRKIATFMYKMAFSICDRVSFQNDDDMRYFIEKKIVDNEKAVLIRSSGIDLDEFSPESFSTEQAQRLREELHIANDSRIVMMIARATWSKGIREFIEASKLTSQMVRNVVFILVGGIEKEPDSVSATYLEENQGQYFRWMGFQDRIKGLLALADIVVLPSYYREGIPRCLLEAMAMGKPIITTNNVGCREVIEEGKNGYLVPAKNVEALAKKVLHLLSNKNELEEFGRYSRQKVEKEFSEALVVQKTISNLYYPTFQ